MQHLSGSYPSSEWTPEQLTAYARAQQQAIKDDECNLAVRYRRLGLALELLRKNFNYSQWEALLDQLNIEKTKAARARAIARTFAKEEDLAGLTVTEAYDRRQRKEKKSLSTAAAEGQASSRLEQFLEHVTKTAELVIDEAGFAPASIARALLPVVDATIAKMEQIRDLLRQRSLEESP